MKKIIQVAKPLACLIALSVAGVATSGGIERSDKEIWHPSPKNLESMVDTDFIPTKSDHSDVADKRNEGEGDDHTDIKLLAKQSGFSYEQAAAAIAAQDELARYADKVMHSHRDKVARIWKEPAPSTESHIQFVGEMPDTVSEDILKNVVPEGVSITGGATISLDDQLRRANVAAKGLRKAGYKNSLSFYDIANDVIQLEVKVPSHAPQPDPALILSAIENEMRGTDLRDHIRDIFDHEVKVKTIRGEGPIMEFDHVTGGNWLRDDGGRECTSGWSVSGPRGDGFITAAHCSGINQFEEANGTVFNTTWRDQEFGSGDVEYHTTGHVTLDDFWASSTDYRDVSGIRSWSSMFGASVCEYGRSNNVRTCNHTVDALSVTLNYTQGTVNNLVRVTRDNSIGGDSGGGWSFGNVAWGVHSGSGAGTSESTAAKSYFTAVQWAEIMLGVTIKR